jgi:hypothetical protein
VWNSLVDVQLLQLKFTFDASSEECCHLDIARESVRGRGSTSCGRSKLDDFNAEDKFL